MPKELKRLLHRGKKVRDHLARLSHEAARISAEADKVLVRPESTLPNDVPEEALEKCLLPAGPAQAPSAERL